MPNDGDGDTPRRKRGRSPSYPGTDLQDALERAEAIYAIEGEHAAHIDTLAKHLGYSPGSGTFNVVITALRKFGLIEYEGSGDDRAGRLTDLAVSIIIDERPGSSERRQNIQRAALNPSVHQELWEAFGTTLPSDATLRFRLMREWGFTKSAVDDFIEEYKSTIAFAGLEEEPPGKRDAEELPLDPAGGAGSAVRSAGRVAPASHDQSHSPRTASSEDRSVLIPLPGGSWVQVVGPFPLTEAAWDQMLKVLGVMKPGLVEEAAEEYPARSHNTVEPSKDTGAKETVSSAPADTPR